MVVRGRDDAGAPTGPAAGDDGADADAAAERFFEGQPGGLRAYRRVRDLLVPNGPFDVRATETQVAFRRRRGFAYLWQPGRWLTDPDAALVLSVGTSEPIGSDRFKEVVHPTPTVWMHHLELHDLEALTELDDEVADWLHRAYGDAA
jgi:hypothetical protein